jgi:predicted PurR-regulated permease PerM
MVAPLFLLAAALATVWMLEPVFALEQPLLNYISIAMLFAFLLWMVVELYGRWNRGNSGGMG